ncbi:hypothetical protein CSOJ01_07184 [Colletotrichum sojae]|uniref:Uncharacterized protein n=1 Tax=Colletotrichum sojae TaxID=2175907 RepID=A0A8H6MUP7_9PEZI|nr:hypothetical protein CSOJ01_07184 [Colletotrichum sojae]
MPQRDDQAVVAVKTRIELFSIPCPPSGPAENNFGLSLRVTTTWVTTTWVTTTWVTTTWSTIAAPADPQCRTTPQLSGCRTRTGHRPPTDRGLQTPLALASPRLATVELT